MIDDIIFYNYLKYRTYNLNGMKFEYYGLEAKI